MKLSLNWLCCQVNILRAAIGLGPLNDPTPVAPLADRVTALEDVYNVEEVHGTGTAYALTNVAAAVDLGTQDPTIVLGEAGRYLILATLKVEYTGATVAAETATFKLRRTNNTPADIAGTPVVVDLPASTALTHTYGVIHLPPVEYTTALANDAITIFGNVSAALGAGTIDVSMADIVAMRIA